MSDRRKYPYEHDKEFAREVFINAINMALKGFTYEQVDEVFIKVMKIYKKTFKEQV